MSSPSRIQTIPSVRHHRVIVHGRHRGHRRRQQHAVTHAPAGKDFAATLDITEQPELFTFRSGKVELRKVYVYAEAFHSHKLTHALRLSLSTIRTVGYRRRYPPITIGLGYPAESNGLTVSSWAHERSRNGKATHEGQDEFPERQLPASRVWPSTIGH